jgi:cation diffusion facilitator family transporter
MINFLRKLFIKNYNNTNDEKVRADHGKLAALIGIFSNFLLFLIKMIIGIISFSVSIIADSINNLSDMATSIATLVGFHIASRPADKEHPYGHERIEYITGLIVSVFIIFIGGILGFTSILKIINYKVEDIDYIVTYISIGILVFAIILKVLQCICYRSIAKIISSPALKAAAADSLNDCISTGAVLIGTVIILILSIVKIDVPFSIDGILGVLVSLFVIVSGIKLVKDEIDPLIGVPVSKDFVKQINEYIKSFDVVLGTHDIMCHMYGPTKCYMTIHVEVDSRGNVVEIHDKIDEIETSVKEKFNVILTIHMDPVIIGNPEIDMIKEIVDERLKQIDDKLNFHDLRLVKKNISTVIFDIVVNFDFRFTEKELETIIEDYLHQKTSNRYVVIINYDHSFVESE